MYPNKSHDRHDKSFRSIWWTHLRKSQRHNFFHQQIGNFWTPPNPTNPTKLEAQPIPYALHTNNTPIFFCVKKPGKGTCKMIFDHRIHQWIQQNGIFLCLDSLLGSHGGRVFLLTPVSSLLHRYVYSKLGHTITTQKSSGHKKLSLFF